MEHRHDLTSSRGLTTMFAYTWLGSPTIADHSIRRGFPVPTVSSRIRSRLGWPIPGHPTIRICTYIILRRTISRPCTTPTTKRPVSTDMLTAFETPISELRPDSAEICSYVTVHRIVSRPIARRIPKSSVSFDALTIRITLLSELRPDSAGRCRVPSWLRTLAS